MDIIHNFSDIIVATHYGHDHADSFKILQDEQGNILQSVHIRYIHCCLHDSITVLKK